MVDRADLRASVRVRLEDSSNSPVFSDVDLNDLIHQAIREYGEWVPKMASAAPTVLLDAISIPMPAGATAESIVAVRDFRGKDVIAMNGRAGLGPEQMLYNEQAWRAWGGTIRLQRKVTATEAGAWAIDYETGREPVDDDVTAQPIEVGHEPIVIELTIARVYDRRRFEDVKRGREVSGVNPAVEAREIARKMLEDRRRNARMGWVDVS
jgi:hypothetical protein